MDINNIGGSLNIIQAGGARRVEVKVPVAETQPAPVPQPQLPQPQSDQARIETLKAAAAVAIKNLYVVSDTTFTIFKDASGQYITRIKSLRDGSIRTFPEFSMYDFVRSLKAASSNLDTEA